MFAGASIETLKATDTAVLDERPRPTQGYALHGTTAEPMHGTLREPGGTVWEIPFAHEDLGELRSRVADWAMREQMPYERVEDLVLAVHEIAANSVRHGGGAGLLRLWRDGRTLICEVGDRGYIENPLMALRAPDMRSGSGRGLWIANTVCDLVQIHSSPDGSRVRLHKLIA